MTTTRLDLKQNRFRRRWREFGLFLFALLASFFCVSLATLLALNTSPNQDIPATIRAQSTADYREISNDLFEPVDIAILLEATADAKTLAFTPETRSEGDKTQIIPIFPVNTATIQPSPTPLPPDTGALTPSPTSFSSATASPSFSPTSVEATPTPSPTVTSTPTWTPIPPTIIPATHTPTPHLTAPPTATANSSNTSTPVPTLTATLTNTPTNSTTPTPSSTLMRTPTPASTLIWTPSPTSTRTPTSVVSNTPTLFLTPTPWGTFTATITPSSSPAATNSVSPTITSTFAFAPTNTSSPSATSTFTPSSTWTLTPTPTDQPIIPFFICRQDNGNGTFTAYFGYVNFNAFSVHIPIGASNEFSPHPLDRGQPTDFSPGFIAPAVVVIYDGTSLVWHLDGINASAVDISCP